ncbi:MAG: 4'-phosphopantetheinyl transferase superfamily protein [Actinomycetota bacterium]
MRIHHGDTVVDVLPLAACEPDRSLLPDEDRARHARFVDAAAADSYLRRQSALRRRLGEELGIDPAAVALTTAGNLKPILATTAESDDNNVGAEPGPTVHFNLSASGPLMVLAVDRTGPVGVDIECHKIHDGLTASSLTPALHPRELEQLAGDDLDDILQCWVFKEAWIKWTGEGMRADLKNLRLWRPGLTDAFTFDGAAVRLDRIGAGGDHDPSLPAAWVGLVKADVTAVGGPLDRGI